MRLFPWTGVFLLVFGLQSALAQSGFSNHKLSLTSHYSIFSEAFNNKGISIGIEYKNSFYKNFGFVASVNKRFISTTNQNRLFFCGLDCGIGSNTGSWEFAESHIYNTDLGINYTLPINNRHFFILSSGFHQRNIFYQEFGRDTELITVKEVFNGYFSSFEYAFVINEFISFGLTGKIQFAKYGEDDEISRQGNSINIYNIGTSISYLF